MKSLRYLLQIISTLTIVTCLSSYKNSFYSYLNISIYLYNYNNPLLNELYYNNTPSCYSGILNAFESSRDLVDYYFSSGKDYDDWGDYSHCMFSTISMYASIVFKDNSDNSTNYIGLCLPLACKDYLNYVLKNDTLHLNHALNMQNLNVTIDANLTSIYTGTDKKNQKQISVVAQNFFTILIIYVLVVISASIWDNLDNQFCKKETIDISRLSNSSSRLIESRNFIEVNKKKTFFECFSFIKAVKIIYSDKTNYYQDNDLEQFLHIKYFSLLGIVCMKMYYSFKGRVFNLEELDFQEYSNYFFAVLKLLYYSENVYILITGFLFCYKLLTYIKKNKDSSFSTFFRFYSIAFTRFLCYYLVAIVTIYFSDQMFKYFGKLNIVNDRNYGMSKYSCKVGPYWLFTPLVYNLSCPENYFGILRNQCNSVIILISSEFYIFTFSTFSLYLIFRFKKPILEKIICIVPIIGAIVVAFYYSMHTEKRRKYTNEYILFSTKLNLRPQILITTYLFGALIGIIYYLHKNPKNNDDSDNQETIYIPFDFLNYLTVAISKYPKMAKLMKYVCLLLALLVSFNFAILKFIYSDTIYYELEFQNYFVLAIFILEQKIFCFFIGLYIVFTIPEEDLNKKLSLFSLQSISRSSYCILLASQLSSDIVYMKICGWMPKYLNSFNIIVINMSNFMFTCLVGIILNIFFEAPFRIMRKNFFPKEMRKEY